MDEPVNQRTRSILHINQLWSDHFISKDLQLHCVGDGKKQVESLPESNMHKLVFLSPLKEDSQNWSWIRPNPNGPKKPDFIHVIV